MRILWPENKNLAIVSLQEGKQPCNSKLTTGSSGTREEQGQEWARAKAKQMPVPRGGSRLRSSLPQGITGSSNLQTGAVEAMEVPRHRIFEMRQLLIFEASAWDGSFCLRWPPLPPGLVRCRWGSAGPCSMSPPILIGHLRSLPRSLLRMPRLEGS